MTYFEEGYEVHDGTGSEVLVQCLLYALVRVVKPRLIVETGCYDGITTHELGMAALANGGGQGVISCDVDPLHVHGARMRCADLPVEVRECRGIDLPELRTADFVFLDSTYADRLVELEATKPGALVVIHDTKACLSEGIDLAQIVRDHGGILFDTYRGFGLLRRGPR